MIIFHKICATVVCFTLPQQAERQPTSLPSVFLLVSCSSAVLAAQQGMLDMGFEPEAQMWARSGTSLWFLRASTLAHERCLGSQGIKRIKQQNNARIKSAARAASPDGSGRYDQVGR